MKHYLCLPLSLKSYFGAFMMSELRAHSCLIAASCLPPATQPPTCFCHKHHLGMASSYWYWGLHTSPLHPSTCWPGLTLNLMQNVGSSEITVKIYKLTTNEASSGGIFNFIQHLILTGQLPRQRKLFSYKAKGADIL